MSWSRFPRYVPVGERVRKAKAAASKADKAGGREPVALEGSKIATTFWGKSWCAHLESFSDYSNRLPRGRSYVRNGLVIDLRIQKGVVEALVQGSSLYKVRVAIAPLPAPRWTQFVESATDKVTQVIDLLQGRLPPALLQSVTHPASGLFPRPAEITLSCSCPDWADMCKHVAATLYGVGARLDRRPELFFTLRGVDMNDLVVAAGQTAAAVPTEGVGAGLEGEDLSALFGVEIESTATPSTPAPAPPAAAQASSNEPVAAARPTRSKRRPVARTRPTPAPPSKKPKAPGGKAAVRSPRARPEAPARTPKPARGASPGTRGPSKNPQMEPVAPIESRRRTP